MDLMNIKGEVQVNMVGIETRPNLVLPFCESPFISFCTELNLMNYGSPKYFCWKRGVIEFQPLVYSGCSILTPEFPILVALVVSTVQPLHGSPQNGHAMFYLFQKHLFFWDYNICTEASCEL